MSVFLGSSLSTPISFYQWSLSLWRTYMHSTRLRLQRESRRAATMRNGAEFLLQLGYIHLPRRSAESSPVTGLAACHPLRGWLYAGSFYFAVLSRLPFLAHYGIRRRAVSGNVHDRRRLRFLNAPMSPSKDMRKLLGKSFFPLSTRGWSFGIARLKNYLNFVGKSKYYSVLSWKIDYWMSIIQDIKDKYIYIYRVRHIKCYRAIAFKLLIISKNVSDKSFSVREGPHTGSPYLPP